MQQLEKIYKSFHWFFSNLINTFFSFCKIFLISGFNQKIHKTTSHHTCIILGNGPSLSNSLKEYQNHLTKYPLVCVNLFALTSEYEQLKPAYYVMHDPALWKTELPLPQKVFTAIKEKTNWPITLFFPYRARKSAFVQALNSEYVKVVYYNYTIFKGFDAIAYYLFKRQLAMPQSQNVLVASLFLTINLKYKEIYFIGADHTWHENLIVNDENILCLKNVHFYSEGEQVSYKPFYKGLNTQETFKVSEIFENWTKVFRGYEHIKKYAKYCNTTIYNASHVSFIDAFERKKIS
ncbi:6-hydroxymethylpterin diphosphokinase MptE-like protein [Pedobacter glucosidilyticus]|uniref:6-hydroxymethylpterin diphosphokinase MptE-like protein n=1 Tax=Pedobacter glucosidilyticus TaxID=1122941 RepID=UPI0026F2E85B|nr:6-hydroxymethylpterin diphosphokinase MptE-like protein [Pedobacter glucosidilyticus]